MDTTLENEMRDQTGPAGDDEIDLIPELIAARSTKATPSPVIPPLVREPVPVRPRTWRHRQCRPDEHFYPSGYQVVECGDGHEIRIGGSRPATVELARRVAALLDLAEGVPTDVLEGVDAGAGRLFTVPRLVCAAEGGLVWLLTLLEGVRAVCPGFLTEEGYRRLTVTADELNRAVDAASPVPEGVPAEERAARILAAAEASLQEARLD